MEIHAPTSHLRIPPGTHRGAGPAGRRDRRAVGASRGRHRAPPRPHPRVRRPRRLEHWLPLLRRLAELARGPRPGRGPGAGPRGARPGDAAAAGPGPRARGAVVCQGPRPHARRHAGDRSAAARGGARRHRRPRRADRAGLAVRGPQGRSARDRAPAREPGAARPPRRRRHRGAPRAAGAGGGGVAPAGARRRPRDAVPARPSRARRLAEDPVRGAARPWPSSRRMRWPCSRRRRSTTSSIPARRASATRSWSTSMPPALADPEQPGQSVLEDGARVSAEPDMWRSPLPVDLKRSTIARGGRSRGRSRYWCRPSPARNLTRGVARYPVVSPQRAL